MLNRINCTETKAYRPNHQEEVDIMSVEREAYIRERYRDTISYPIEHRKTVLDKILQRIMYWFS